jgi:hypothetical protein
MTEAEWDSSTALRGLIAASGPAAGGRRLRLVSAACARRVAPARPDDAARALIGRTERRADGLVGDRERGGTLAAVLDRYLGNEPARDGAGGATFGILMNIDRDDPQAVLRLAGSVVETRTYFTYHGGSPADVGPVSPAAPSRTPAAESPARRTSAPAA